MIGRNNKYASRWWSLHLIRRLPLPSAVLLSRQGLQLDTFPLSFLPSDEPPDNAAADRRHTRAPLRWQAMTWLLESGGLLGLLPLHGRGFCPRRLGRDSILGLGFWGLLHKLRDLGFVRDGCAAAAVVVGTSLTGGISSRD